MTKQPTALYLADVIDNDPKSAAHHKAAADELRRLHGQVEALKADAERYRWLRTRAWFQRATRVDLVYDYHNPDKTLQKLDAAIDVMRSKYE